MKYAIYALPAVLFFAVAASADEATTTAAPGTPLALLAHERVQKELKLTDKQADLKTLAAKVNKGETKAADAVAALKKSLTAEQQARLNEISYQVRGGAALTDADVTAALKLTKQQASDAEKTWKDEEASLKSFLARARFASAEAMRAHVAGHRKKAGEKMLGVLTDEQKKAFTKMQGRAFDTAGLDRE